MAPHGDHDDAYHPKDAIGAALKATMITSGAGAFVSTVQNTLTRQNRGAMGFLTKTGGTIAVFGATPTLSPGLRERIADHAQVRWEEHTNLPNLHPQIYARRTTSGTLRSVVSSPAQFSVCDVGDFRQWQVMLPRLTPRSPDDASSFGIWDIDGRGAGCIQLHRRQDLGLGTRIWSRRVRAQADVEEEQAATSRGDY